jgi:hypothetical protein
MTSPVSARPSVTAMPQAVDERIAWEALPTISRRQRDELMCKNSSRERCRRALAPDSAASGSGVTSSTVS